MLIMYNCGYHYHCIYGVVYGHWINENEQTNTKADTKFNSFINLHSMPQEYAQRSLIVVFCGD